MRMMRSVAMGLVLAALCRAQEGSQVFISRCIQCHDPNSESHAPLPEALANLPWQDILKTLETGSMKAMGASVERRGQEWQWRATWAKPGRRRVPEMKGFCAAGAKPKAGGSSWNGWGVDERNTRFQPAKAAGTHRRNRFPDLQVKWAFGFPNTVTAYSQPTVVGGRVYTGSNDGTVYALDAQSGCLYWMYQAKAMVRDAVVIGPGPRAYFGDLESNFYALDANTGKLVWQKKLDNQPFTRITGTAKLHDGRLYVPIASQEENAGANPQYSCCTFRGNLVVVKASDGSIVWRTYTTPEPKPTRKSAAGVQYYGPSGRDHLVLAHARSEAKVGIRRRGQRLLGAGHQDRGCRDRDGHGDRARSSGPSRPRRTCSIGDARAATAIRAIVRRMQARTSIWAARRSWWISAAASRCWCKGRSRRRCTGWIPTRTARSYGPRGSASAARAAAFSGASLPETVWCSPDWVNRLAALRRQLPSTGLFAIDPATGKIVWHEPAPTPSCAGQRGCSVSQKSPPTAIPGVVFSPSMDGHVRAYDTKTGKIIWDFDTAREFPTVNGIPAKGGSMAATGATVADGMLYVNSGYSGMRWQCAAGFRCKVMLNSLRLLLFASLTPLLVCSAAEKTLTFYTIDVEGGKSVLVVSPSGESMLFDAGWPAARGREASNARILAALRGAGLKQLDYLVISHFDIDHIGDVPALAAQFPIRHILDHGQIQFPPGATPGSAAERFTAYAELRQKIGHKVLKPGDKIPLKGVDIEVLTAGRPDSEQASERGGRGKPFVRK